MTVVGSQQDVDALTLTFVAEFTAGPDRVWQVWQDPRQLERWWGPPGWPATFGRHDFVTGGESRYYMTGPDGERFHGWWRITAIEPPRRLEFEDGFADGDGEPLREEEPLRCVVALEPAGSGTRMTTVTTFASMDQLEQMAEMGMEEGMRTAMGQIDGLLVDAPS